MISDRNKHRARCEYPHILPSSYLSPYKYTVSVKTSLCRLIRPFVCTFWLIYQLIIVEATHGCIYRPIIYQIKEVNMHLSSFVGTIKQRCIYLRDRKKTIINRVNFKTTLVYRLVDAYMYRKH